MKPLLIHEEAESEFRSAVAYYESKCPGLGLDFAAEVETCYSAIRGTPMRYPFYKETELQRCVTRRFPYVIFYREYENQISIVAVAHAKRRPDYWKRRAAD